jgi:hypothetical protein
MQHQAENGSERRLFFRREIRRFFVRLPSENASFGTFF